MAVDFEHWRRTARAGITLSVLPETALEAVAAVDRMRAELERVTLERDEWEGRWARLDMRVRVLIQGLAKYADHDNWPDMTDDDDMQADPLWFDLQGEAVYRGWEPAESALIVAGLCRVDGDEVVECEPGTVWPVAASQRKATQTEGETRL